MADKVEKRPAAGWKEVEVLGETYEPGRPQGEDAGRWRQKLASRDEKIKYLQTGERYWYSNDWYGSEKRKKPA